MEDELGHAVHGQFVRAHEKLLGRRRERLDARELGKNAVAVRREARLDVHVQVGPPHAVALRLELGRLGHVNLHLEVARLHVQQAAGQSTCSTI